VTDVRTTIIGRETGYNGLNVTSDVNNKVALDLYLGIFHPFTGHEGP